MGPISASIVVDAPRERVFALLADLATRPAFTDHFARDFQLTRLDSGGPGAAARFGISPPLGRTWLETAVEEADPPHRIVERGRTGRMGRVPATTVFEIADAGDAMSLVTVTFWTEPSHPVDLLKAAAGAGRWWRRRWSRALRRLRDLLESDAPEVERVAVAGGNRHRTGIR